MYFASLRLVDCKSRKRNPLSEQASRVCLARRKSYFGKPNYLAADCCLGGGRRLEDSNLVDPASSHMLVSKTKPCMSKYK